MWGIVIAALMLGALIFMHELGHYSMARLLKVEVKELAIGFGKRIWQRVSPRSGIAYTARLLPFGGYTAFLTQEDVEGRHAAPSLPYEEQPAWKRMLITLAGPAVNLLLALLLSTGLWYADEVSAHLRASAESPALLADRPLLWEECRTAPDWSIPASGAGQENLFLSGMACFGEALAYAAHSPGNALETVGGWLTGLIALGDAVTGSGLNGALTVMLLCSLSMGLFNLIPIPGLDGGQVLMLALEMVRGRKLSGFWQNIYEWVCLGAVGMLLLCMGINDVITLVKLFFPAG